MSVSYTHLDVYKRQGWLYVESGNVRGFVKASEIYTEDAAQELLDVYQTQARLKASKENKDYTGIEGTAKTAQALIAVSYTHLCQGSCPVA